MALEIENLTGVGLMKKVNGKVSVIMDRANEVSEAVKKQIIDRTLEQVESEYVDKDAADETYLSKEDASDTYLTKTDASDTYLTKTDASSTYLTRSDASGLYLPLAGGTLTGATYAPTPSTTDSSTRLATTSFVRSQITYGTGDLTAGSSSLTTGTIYLVYE